MKLAASVLILCAAALGIKVATGSSVTLTVQNEIRDISCNKTIEVKLLCEGVNLILLRWLYTSVSNRYNIIRTYFPDEAPDETPLPISSSISPVFLTVQLLEVTHDRYRANFSSILTVNLSELKNQNVTKIVCGDVDTLVEKSVTELVDEVIKPQPKVTATYQQGILNDIRVQLNNLFIICFPIIMYTVSITGSAEIRSIYINSCTGPFCEVRFTAPNLQYDEEGNTHLTVSLLTNLQTTKIVDIQIRQRVDHYFLPQVSSSDCSHTPECRRVLNESLSPCTVQYSTSLLPTLPTVPPSLDTPLPQQTPGTLHTFNFSLQLNELLYITESITVTDAVPSLGLREITIVITTCIFLSLTFAHLLLVFIGAYCKVTAFKSEIKVLTVSMVPLVLQILLCISFLITFQVIVNTTACSSVESSSLDNILEIMLVVSCLGITLLITIWSYLGYSLYKRQKTGTQSDASKYAHPQGDNKREDCSTINHDNICYGIQRSTSKENLPVQKPTTNKNPANAQEYQYVAVEPKRCVEIVEPPPTMSLPADQTVDNEYYHPHDESTNEDKKDDSSIIHHQNVCYGTQISS